VKKAEPSLRFKGNQVQFELNAEISGNINMVLSELGQLSATYLVQLQHPQTLQPVALLMFTVEAIPMFLLTVPIQICQAKLVPCFTGRSSMSTQIHANHFTPPLWLGIRDYM
jgi:hypothetical protein